MNLPWTLRGTSVNFSRSYHASWQVNSSGEEHSALEFDLDPDSVDGMASHEMFGAPCVTVSLDAP